MVSTVPGCRAPPKATGGPEKVTRALERTGGGPEALEGLHCPGLRSPPMMLSIEKVDLAPLLAVCRGP